MLYVFPDDTLAMAHQAYARPYEDPIAVRAGGSVRPHLHPPETTDILGWTWCVADDGREGWTPDAWFEIREDVWIARHDFSALELTVAIGDQLTLLLSESGFLLCRNQTGEIGWVPDAIMTLIG